MGGRSEIFRDAWAFFGFRGHSWGYMGIFRDICIRVSEFLGIMGRFDKLIFGHVGKG